MSDVVARAAKRQNLLDAYVEYLTDVGDRHAHGHATRLLELAEGAGWSPPVTPADDRPPPPAASTPEGRANARRLYAETRAARHTHTTPDR